MRAGGARGRGKNATGVSSVCLRTRDTGDRACRSAVWNDGETLGYWRGDFDAQEGGRTEGATRSASCSVRSRGNGT